jgi:hypothetical protein
VAFVLLFVLPSLSGCSIRGVGKITFSWMQIFYGLLSLELALAVYVWGVGNWSRFEPPEPSSASSIPATSDPSKAPAPGQPIQPNTEQAAQPAGAPPAAQGGR